VWVELVRPRCSCRWRSGWPTCCADPDPDPDAPLTRISA
jgi:hypothetical protein